MRKKIAKPAALGLNRRAAQADAKGRDGGQARRTSEESTINRKLHLKTIPRRRD
jgi:hypothetical protein